jgi:HAD superfamily hydrolase (TIGR01509 family)
MQRLRALLIDVGGTLVNDATWIAWDKHRELRLRRLAEALGEERPWFAELVDLAFEEGAASSFEQRTAAAVTAFLVERGHTPSEAEVEAVCRANAVPMRELVELEEHALEAMRAARALGLRMAICSNTWWRDDVDSRRDWEELGFGDLFDAHVTSHSTGYEKPHPAMFERCLGALGATAAAATMVGDRPERDIAGARAVGMRAIWKRPFDFEGDPDPAPDATITCLADLPPILEAWSKDPDQPTQSEEA